MNDEQKRENWERMISKGMIRLIFEVGILRVVLPSMVFTQIIVYVLEHGFTSSNIGEFLTESRILALLFGTLVGGVVFGLMMWFWGMKKYQKQISRSKE